MALAPIQFISDFMEEYPNWWLKAYEQGTTTPLAMAIDSSGSPTVAKAEISAGPTPPLGLIKTAGNVTFIPYIDEAYDLYIFPTEAEADANDTVNAIQLADDVDFLQLLPNQVGGVIVAGMVANTVLIVGDFVNTVGHQSNGDGGDNQYEIVAGGTGADDNFLFIDLDNGLQAKGLFPGDIYWAAQAGNDSAALQVALNTTATLGVQLSINTDYDLSSASTITIPATANVVCDEGVVFTGTGSATGVFESIGTVATAFELTSVANMGDTTIAVNASSNFSAGDLIHLISVKNSLSRVDAGSFFLGDGTASLPFAYFAEFFYIAEVLGGGSYRISRELSFDGYEINAAGETETGRTQSTCQVVTPTTMRWTGGKILKTDTGKPFQVTYGLDVVIDNVEVVRGAVFGESFRFDTSYNCEGRNLMNTNDPELDWVQGTHHGNLNRFKIIGSHNCGFYRIKDSYAAQSVDFSYGSTIPVCNIAPYCKESRFEGCFEGLTSHPGSYREQWLGNYITDCWADGIVVRGYEPVVRGNSIYANKEWIDADGLAGADQTYGVSLNYGGPRRADVHGNTFRGFWAAVHIVSSPTRDLVWDNVLSDISDNQISGCYQGLNTNVDDPVNGFQRFINYTNNAHSNMGRFIVDLSEYSAGVNIIGNTMDGDFRYNGVNSTVSFVVATTNCPTLTVKDNAWRIARPGTTAKTARMFANGGVTDTTTYPEADWGGTSEIMNNTHPETVGYSYSNVGYNQFRYSEFQQETFTIATADVLVHLKRHGTTFLNLDIGSSGNLDTLSPDENIVFNDGDIVAITIESAARTITLRDIATSSASLNGFQLPGGTSVTLDTLYDTILLMKAGTHWATLSVEATN
jgi:hypothetical protein